MSLFTIRMFLPASDQGRLKFCSRYILHHPAFRWH
jgi:hypothetical protein